MKNTMFTYWLKLSGLFFFFIFFSSAQVAEDSAQVSIPKDKKGLVYIFEIRREIAKPVLRITQEAFDEAVRLKASYIIIHLNTYGGRVDIADSIRTKILNSTIPVLVFVDNQAISAGALIAIAADSIYMRQGGSIGAATVVDQSGQAVPDKYQSFMRSTMRATAEAHGKDTIIKGADTMYVWHRNPYIAEAMVDPSVSHPGIVDSGKVLTLTVEEAIKVGYCEGKATSLQDVIEQAGLNGYETREYTLSTADNIAVFLLNPIVQTILILLIIGGIYFELQAPGIGLPLGLAVCAALLYFAPLYVEGLAENWEILVFIAGIILLGIEIFVIPGFGVAGISGILLILTGLTMALIDNVVFKFEGIEGFSVVAKVFLRIIITVVTSLVLTVWLSKKIGVSGFFKGLALEANQDSSDGFVSSDIKLKEMIGKEGVAFTVLRPSGRVKIDEQVYDAIAEMGFIDRGTTIKVIRNDSGQLYVKKI